MSQSKRSKAAMVRRQVHRQVRRRSKSGRRLTEFMCLSTEGALRRYAATCDAEAEAMHARAQARRGDG